MHQSDRGQVIIDGMLNRFAHQTTSSLLGDRFDTDTAALIKANFLYAHFILQKANQLFRLGAIGLPLNTGVDILRVFTKDNHVGLFRMNHRTRHTFKPAHWANTGIQIQLLAQGHVQRANTTAHRCGQRPFNGDAIFLQGLQCLWGQPDILAIDLGRFLAGVDLHPDNLALAAIGFGYRRIDHFQHGGSDIHTNTIPLNKRNNRMVGNIEGVVGVDGDLLTVGRNLNMLVSHSDLHCMERVSRSNTGAIRQDNQ